MQSYPRHCSRSFMYLLAACINLALFVFNATPAHAAVTIVRKSGQCKLQKTRFRDRDRKKKIHVVNLGKTITFKCEFYYGEFIRKSTIYANAHVHNTTKKALHYRYNVVFFDKDKNLVGCESHGSFGSKGLAAGEKTQTGSCLIECPEHIIKTVTSYQITIYISDEPIGKPSK